MPFAVVTVETESGEQRELALPLDVPSRAVAAKIMRDLGRAVRTGETFVLFIPTGHGDKRIAPTATLGEHGIRDRQHLRIKREMAGSPAQSIRAHAFLRTNEGVLLALEGNNIIIGRKDGQFQTPLDLDLARYDPGHAVSRRHACIGREARTYYLLDLQSTNGTKLNGETIISGRKVLLKDGDSIEFGLGLQVTFVTAKAGAGKAD